MANNNYSNPCFKCGKERITVKEWVEEIPTFAGTVQKVTRSLTACPDADCQKEVDAELEALRLKREKQRQTREAKLQSVAAKKKQSVGAFES